MANLIIKPTSGGSLILQDEGGDAALTVGTTGVSTIANATITTGTIAAATTFPNGHIIQVVQHVSTTLANTTSGSLVDVTGYSKAITPSATSNKILVMMDFSMTNEAGHTLYSMHRAGGSSGNGNIYIGGSSTTGANFSGSVRQNHGGHATQRHMLVYLDSPGVTTAVTYKLQFRNLDGSGTSRFNSNNDGTTNAAAKPVTPSSITLMEVKA